MPAYVSICQYQARQTRCHALEGEKASCAFIRQHTSAYVREGVLCLAARSTVRRVGERLLSGSADRWLSGDMWGEGVLAARSGVRVLVPRPNRVRVGRREKEFVGNTPPPAAAFLRVCVCVCVSVCVCVCVHIHIRTHTYT